MLPKVFETCTEFAAAEGHDCVSAVSGPSISLNQRFSPWGVRAVNDLPDAAEMLLGMEAVEDLNGLREPFG